MAKLWRPKNTFQLFLFQLYFKKKNVEVAINDLIISRWLKIQKCRQKSKVIRQRGQSERRNCQRKNFHSFNYVIDHASIRFFFYVNSLHCFVWFLLYYLLHFLSSTRFEILTIYSHTKFLFEYMNFFINHPQKRVFRYVSLSNLENVLQKIQKQTARECISRVSGGTNFEHSSNRASRDGAFMGSVFVPAAQKFSGYVTSLMSQ